MKRTTRAASALAIAATMSLGAAGAVQAQDDEAPSYSEFKAQTFKDPADGQYIVDGDIPLRGEQSLRDFYGQLTQDNSNHLIVNQIYGGDDVWTGGQAQDLTYCVSEDFGADHDKIATAMEAGAGQWEQASSGVDFTYDSSQDANCTTTNDSVLFSVEPVTGAQYIARAFFPSTEKSTRNVLVNTDQIFSSGWSAENVLAHELGHTLGFRHEHTRPEAGTCFEDDNWRPLTPYDSESIMHYPQCNGTSQDLSMSDMDREGIASIYGQ